MAFFAAGRKVQLQSDWSITLKFRNQAENLNVNEHNLYNISTHEWKIPGGTLVQVKLFQATVQMYQTILQFINITSGA